MNHKLDTDKQVFFYEQEFYVLSNYSSFSLFWRGVRFDNSEAAYHYSKFPGWTDSAETNEMHNRIRRLIYQSISAHDSQQIANEYKAYVTPNWNEIKVPVMKEILKTKVAQHNYVKKKLLETGDRELIEDSWRDDFWGWGENKDGKNMLGKLWMEVRAELKAQNA